MQRTRFDVGLLVINCDIWRY